MDPGYGQVPYAGGDQAYYQYYQQQQLQQQQQYGYGYAPGVAWQQAQPAYQQPQGQPFQTWDPQAAAQQPQAGSEQPPGAEQPAMPAEQPPPLPEEPPEPFPEQSLPGGFPPQGPAQHQYVPQPHLVPHMYQQQQAHYAPAYYGAGHPGAHWQAHAPTSGPAPVWAAAQPVHPQAPRAQTPSPLPEPAAPDNSISGASLFLPPGRASRAGKLAIILRGLPGSGKSHVARLIKDLEAQHGAGSARIHSIDDYFVTDVEKEEAAEGPRAKRRKVRVQEFLYEPELEGLYMRSLLKAFSSTVEGGRFPVVILDAPNLRVDDFRDFWTIAQGAGYEAYVSKPLEMRPAVCAHCSTHGRSEADIAAAAAAWEPTPATYLEVDLHPLLAPASPQAQGDMEAAAVIEEVTMDEEALVSGSAQAADGVQAIVSRWSSVVEEEQPLEEDKKGKGKPTAEASKVMVLKPIVKRPGKAKRKLVVWRDEAPAENGAAPVLCDVRVLAGLGPPKSTIGRSFAEQAEAHRHSEGTSFRALLLGAGPPA